MSGSGRAPRPRRVLLLLEVLLGLCLSAISSPPTAATLYRWTDQHDVTHFSSDPPPAGVPFERLGVESGGDTRQPSKAFRRRRCRDFREALEQLDSIDNKPSDLSGWRAARERARGKIQQWCD